MNLITAFKAVTSFFDMGTAMFDDKMTDAEKTKLINSRMKDLTLAMTNGSLTKLLSNYIVTPTIIGTHEARNIDDKLYDKIVQVQTDIFSGFYVQGFKILTEQYGKDAVLTVNSLGTKSGVFDSIARESYLDDLLSDNKFLFISKEDDDNPDQDMAEDNNKNKKDFKNSKSKIKLGDTLHDVSKDPLYSINTRSLEIIIKNGDKKDTLVIPITVKANNVIVDVSSLRNMLEPQGRDKEFSYRLDEYRAGAISLKELIFCTDLIKKYKENKIKDKDGLLTLINDQTLGSNLKGLPMNKMDLLGKGSIKGFQASYNMIIITQDEKHIFDKYIGGDIFKEKYKQILLEKCNGMTITIIDPDYERVSILTRDIVGTSIVGFNAIKKRKDSDSNGMEEIVKALMLSKPISF